MKPQWRPYIVSILFVMLFLALVTQAQDATPAIVTATPAVDVVAVTLEAAATEEAAATAAAPVVVNIEQPPAPDNTTQLQATIDAQARRIAELEANTSVPMALVERLGYWAVIAVLGYLVLSSNRSLKDMVTADAARGFYNDAREAVGRVTGAIPGNMDDIGAQVFFSQFKRLLDSWYGTPPTPGMNPPAPPAPTSTEQPG